MTTFTFRPHVEHLAGRVLPSANPVIAIGDAYATEGSSGRTAIVFTVSLSKASKQQVSVKFATADGTATAGPDYQAAANDAASGGTDTVSSDYQAVSGTLTFAPGETTKTITVLVNGDTAPERDEWFEVKLSGARNASIVNPTGSGTIYNDDASPPGLYVDPYSGWLIPDQPSDSDLNASDGPYYPN